MAKITSTTFGLYSVAFLWQGTAGSCTAAARKWVLLLLIPGVKILKGKDELELPVSITVGGGQLHIQACVHQLCFCRLLFLCVTFCSLTTTF